MKNNKLVILSLCDGISCGQVAFSQLFSDEYIYYACEINKRTIAVTQCNFPNTIQLGDIRNWQNWDIDFSEVDFVFAGTPCQGFSRANPKQQNFLHPESTLIVEAVDILNVIKAKNPYVLFLFENVRMKQEWKVMFDEMLGVESVLIDSAICSAQHRIRNYWFNWQYKPILDKGVLLKDLIPDAIREKSRCLRGSDEGHKWGAKREWDRVNPERCYIPEELEIVQGLPLGYTVAAKTKTSRRDAIGNGWQINTIKEILMMLYNEL